MWWAWQHGEVELEDAPRHVSTYASAETSAGIRVGVCCANVSFAVCVTVLVRGSCTRIGVLWFSLLLAFSLEPQDMLTRGTIVLTLS